MILTPSKSALHCLSTLAFIFAGIAVAGNLGVSMPTLYRWIPACSHP
jgi:hypothetical protein